MFSSKNQAQLFSTFCIIRIICLILLNESCRGRDIFNMSERPRLEVLTPDEINELFESRRSAGTNRIIKSAEDTFREFVTAKGLNLAGLAAIMPHLTAL